MYPKERNRFKGIYTSGNSRTAGLVRPNIQKKITDYSVHEMILCIYIKYTSVFFKGIYTSGNSRTAGLVRPNIQKKITDYSVHEMILCIYISTRVYFSKESILQGTHLPPDWFARTSKRREKIIVYMIWYYAYIMYTSVFFKGIYTSGNSRTAGLVRPNIQKKITDYSVHEMILCIII